MTTNCATCGARARFMGSHVMSAHTGYAAGQPAYVAALDAERAARINAAMDAYRAAQPFADESAGAAEGYGTLTDRPVWVSRLVAKDMTYSTGR